ncbi:hypothetical protein V6N13_108636 [Hibiscus sabdariffa]|uniref:Uncharacterized protein n=1 Tax=Hibiscus sabdariffa TaxID=183260 RepID=A0ABR2SSS0_9ROSI
MSLPYWTVNLRCDYGLIFNGKLPTPNITTDTTGEEVRTNSRYDILTSAKHDDIKNVDVIYSSLGKSHVATNMEDLEARQKDPQIYTFGQTHEVHSLVKGIIIGLCKFLWVCLLKPSKSNSNALLGKNNLSHPLTNSKDMVKKSVRLRKGNETRKPNATTLRDWISSLTQKLEVYDPKVDMQENNMLPVLSGDNFCPGSVDF